MELEFDSEEEEEEEISPEEILETYIHKQISLIPQYGDNCLWRIASACDLFGDLNPDGSLTPSQKRTLEDFVKESQNKTQRHPQEK